jgi:hypothetical protein
MNWPKKKEFAFTIIDDTDNSNINNIKPIYDYLASKNIKTTKTVWVYPSRDIFTGQTLQNNNYYKFIKLLKSDGFDIQLHNVGSGNFSRTEIIKGLDEFKQKLGKYPNMHINHCSNADNLYWGHKRFGMILRKTMQIIEGSKKRFYGDEINSNYFWGDIAKEKIKFIRNRVFNGINTLKYDPKMPFREKRKIFSNYWFSSSDGHNLKQFNNLVTKSNIDKLKREKGLCIVYTHFASDFVDQQGKLDEIFKENINYLSKQNGWFVPANDILEYLLSQKKKDYVSSSYINKLDLRWLIDKIKKKYKIGFQN